MHLANSNRLANVSDNKSMRDFGDIFIENLPKHIKVLKISDRKISDDVVASRQPARIDDIAEIQEAMRDVLSDPATKKAESRAEMTFRAFLDKNKSDTGLLKFFNGWYNTHKTTSLVSAKIIMRLLGDAIFISSEQKPEYSRAMAHMCEVARDDFGLGHKGHDGMYTYMAKAFYSASWTESLYEVPECTAFSDFLYEAGVAGHKYPLNSDRHNESIINAMMISIASETWNGREFNYIAQYIEGKLVSFNPVLANEASSLRNAKGFVIGHAGEVENKHGLHALAAAQTFARARDVEFSTERLKGVMLNYNERVGRAFDALQEALESTV